MFADPIEQIRESTQMVFDGNRPPCPARLERRRRHVGRIGHARTVCGRQLAATRRDHHADIHSGQRSGGHGFGHARIQDQKRRPTLGRERPSTSCRPATNGNTSNLALLDFQLGLMWMSQGRLDEARTSFDAAQRHVPAYAPAHGHIAEVEAELGESESAVARLHSLAVSSDDPDYAAQLARILGEDRPRS